MAQEKNFKKLMVVFGALSGWITSLLVLKLGKPLAFVIGSVIVCMEFTNDQEFIKLDWNKINDRFIATPDNFKELNQIWTCANGDGRKKDGTKLSSFLLSFIGGVLIAIGSH